MGQRNNGHLTSLVGQLPHHPPAHRPSPRRNKGPCSSSSGATLLPPSGRAAPHKPNDTPPARPPVRRLGPEGVSARGKKNSFVAVTSSSGLARGVFCDGREEGEKEAPQSATSKSSPSHGRNLIHAEWNTATVFWPFYNFPRNSYMGSD